MEMGKFWIGRRPDTHDPDACYFDRQVWIGQRPRNDADAWYQDGMIWLGRRPSGDPYGKYGNGYIKIGYGSVAIYQYGKIYITKNESIPDRDNIAACYEGDVGGAAAATILLLIKEIRNGGRNYY